MKSFRFLSTSIFFLFLVSGAFAQNNSDNSEQTKTVTQKSEKTTKTEVVVNEKMVARYKSFMKSGEYVSLWETVKDYNYEEMTDYYRTYRNYEFTDETTYPDVKLAYEQNKAEKEKSKTEIISEPEKNVEYLSEAQPQ